VRITIKIERDEDPLVFEMLSAIQKGANRANRARTLLHDGALLHAGGWQKQPDLACDPMPGGDAQSIGAAGIFDDAVTE
jgi:hypothetical protein